MRLQVQVATLQANKSDKPVRCLAFELICGKLQLRLEMVEMASTKTSGVNAVP